MIGSLVVQMVSYWMAESKTAQLAVRTQEKLVLDIADSLRRDELPEFEQRNLNEIRLSVEEARNISTGATQSIRAFQSMVTIFVLWFYMFYLSFVAGIIFLMIYGLMILVHEVFGKVIIEKFFQIKQSENSLYDVFHHFLDGFKELKADSRKNKDLFTNYLKPIIREVRNSKYHLSYMASDFATCISTALFLYLGIIVFILQSLSFSTPTILLIICTLYVVKPSIIVLTSLPQIAQGKAAIMRLRKLSADTEQYRSRDDMMYAPHRKRIDAFDTLSLQDVTFNYTNPDGTPGFSIGPLTLNVNAGEILFISGGNGSGKSTLIKLITGLYPPTHGRSHINGKLVNLSEHKYLFSTIFSDFHLFDALYGVDNPDDERIEKCLAQMQLEAKTSFSEGRFTNLNLSAGQRRRLAMVSALQEDRPIFVFDEWAADQDPQSRRYFYEELLPSLKKEGKTVVAVTHDDRYYHCADRIVVMKDGKFVEERWVDSEPSPTDNSPAFFTSHPLTSDAEKIGAKPLHDGDDAESKPAQEDLDRDDYAFPTLSQLMPFFRKIGYIIIGNGICVVLLMGVIFKVAGQPENLNEAKWFFLFLSLLLLMFTIDRLTHKTVSSNLEDINANVRTSIIDRTRKISLAVFETIGNGRIYTSLTSDMKTLTEASQLLITTITSLTRILFLSFFIAFLSFPLFKAGFIIAFIVGIFYVYNQLQIKKSIESLRKREIDFFNAMTDLLDGFKELRLHDRKNDAFFHTRLKTTARHVSSLRLESSKYMMLNTVLVYSVWTTMMVLIPLMYPYINISPDKMFMSVAIISFLPINALVLLIPPVTLAVEAAKRIKELITVLEQSEQDLSIEIPKSKKVIFQELSCQDLMFQYPNHNGDDRFFVGPMNLRFSEGELIYITGGNGSGKSTLIKLITGLYAPVSGGILLNGQPADIRQHRYLFSVIFSDFHLFDRLYGIPDVDEKRVSELPVLMQLEKKVEYKDGKFSTTKLSAGQKKRLALLIAMMEDRQIYIFDEWAAEQDPYYRRYFYDTLLPGFRKEGKTVVAVTHHDQYFHMADRVIRMEYGKVIAS